MGFYGGLYFVSKIFGAITGGSKKKAPAIAAPAAHGHASSSADIPSVDSPTFGDWLAAPGNVDKFVASFSK